MGSLILKRDKVQNRAHSGFSDKSLEEPKHSSQVISEKQSALSKPSYVSGRIVTSSNLAGGLNMYIPTKTT